MVSYLKLEIVSWRVIVILYLAIHSFNHPGQPHYVGCNQSADGSNTIENYNQVDVTAGIPIGLMQYHATTLIWLVLIPGILSSIKNTF